VEKGSVGDHAAKFANKPFKRKEVSAYGWLAAQYAACIPYAGLQCL
jgi:hypothetical protein